MLDSNQHKIVMDNDIKNAECNGPYDFLNLRLNFGKIKTKNFQKFQKKRKRTKLESWREKKPKYLVLRILGPIPGHDSRVWGEGIQNQDGRLRWVLCLNDTVRRFLNLLHFTVARAVFRSLKQSFCIAGYFCALKRSGHLVLSCMIFLCGKEGRLGFWAHFLILGRDKYFFRWRMLWTML